MIIVPRTHTAPASAPAPATLPPSAPPQGDASPRGLGGFPAPQVPPAWITYATQNPGYRQYLATMGVELPGATP